MQHHRVPFEAMMETLGVDNGGRRNVDVGSWWVGVDSCGKMICAVSTSEEVINIISNGFRDPVAKLHFIS